MRKVWNRGVVLACAVLLLAACNGPEATLGVPAQEFGRLLEFSDVETGTLYGRLLFPSEYTQRSIIFQIGDRTFVTGPDGRFRIAGIPAGGHRISVEIKGYEFLSKKVKVGSDQLNNSGNLKLLLARGVVIGRMVNEHGKSAKRVPVHLAPLNEIALTDNDGIFQFIGVNAGIHTLLIPDPQFFTPIRRFSLRAGEQRNLGIIPVARVTRSAATRTAQVAPPAAQ